MNFNFTANGNTYSAQLWDKVAGKERFYVKNKAGADMGFFDVKSGEFTAKKAWGSAAVKANFEAALTAAIAQNSAPAEIETEVATETEVAQSDVRIVTAHVSDAIVAQIREIESATNAYLPAEAQQSWRADKVNDLLREANRSPHAKGDNKIQIEISKVRYYDEDCMNYYTAPMSYYSVLSF